MGAIAFLLLTDALLKIRKDCRPFGVGSCFVMVPFFAYLGGFGYWDGDRDKFVEVKQERCVIV